MSATDEIRRHLAQQSASRFFLRIGQAMASKPWRDEWTASLFALPLILDAEGMLAKDARHVVDDDAVYLRRCEALIREAAQELRT